MSGFDDARVINTRHGAFTFSRIEIRDITISVLVLTAAFTIIFGDWKLFSDDFVVNTVFWIVSSFLMVILSFMLHELGHKFTAQRFGAWSEYRMYPVGLIICLIGSLFGILFAAPGAVYIRGYITDEMNGKISVMGPAVNILISVTSLLLCVAIGSGLASDLFFLLGYMNAFLAAFNLLPIPPLDGSKILKWNPAIYIMTAVAAVTLFIVSWVI